jgi:palmitoyltransferase
MYYDLTANDDICPFLLRSRQIYENIEYLVAKPFKV